MKKEKLSLSLTREEITALYYSLIKSINEIKQDQKLKKDGYTGQGVIKEIKDLKN